MPEVYLFPGQHIPLQIELKSRIIWKETQNTEKPKSYTLTIKLKYEDSLGPCEPFECVYEYDSDQHSWKYKVKTKNDYTELEPLLKDPNTFIPFIEIPKTASPTAGSPTTWE